MKQTKDQHKVERSFEIGDMVYHKLQPYRQNSVSMRKNLKLASKYYGPYRILQKIGAAAYKLELPPPSHIHLVFHVSMLKRSPKDARVLSDLLVTLVNGIFQVTPHKRLNRIVIMRDGLEVQ